MPGYVRALADSLSSGQGSEITYGGDAPSISIPPATTTMNIEQERHDSYLRLRTATTESGEPIPTRGFCCSGLAPGQPVTQSILDSASLASGNDAGFAGENDI
jgi:hypothetical protein